MENNADFQDLDPQEKLKAENEVLKLKLQAEFGMLKIGTSPEADLKSALGASGENEWLNHIYNFEKQYAEHKLISVFDFLDRPFFRKTDELSEKELSVELERLVDIMESNGVNLDTICEYDESIIYRFITEELFELEIDDIRVPGMRTCFIYEEFHPNHDYDIRKNCEDFVTHLISINPDHYLNNIILASEISYNNKIFKNNTFLQVIEAFQSANQQMGLILFEVLTVQFNLQTGNAFAEGNIKFNVIHSREIFLGSFNLELKYEYNIWRISKVVIPGFSE